MIRKFLANIGAGFMIARLASFNTLGRIVCPVAIRTSISLGVRPQTLAYVFLATSVILDTVGEARYGGSGLDFGWGANVVLHVTIMMFMIETARNIIQQVEEGGQLKPSRFFPLAFELATLWTLVGVLSLTLALAGTITGNMLMRLQSIENILDLLAIGFGWTLITKPPSLWSRIKNRVKDWKPTFVPMPQGA